MADNRNITISRVLEEHFAVNEDDATLISCKLCDFTCITVDCDMQLDHLKTKHAYEESTREERDLSPEGSDFEVIPESDNEEDQSVENEIKDKRYRLSSSCWMFYCNRDPDYATADCRLCGKTFSYRSSTSNLMKHLVRKHGTDAAVESHKDDAGTTICFMKSRKNQSLVYNYYNILDKQRKVAECKVCNAKIKYRTTMSNLSLHIKRKHGVNPLDENVTIDSITDNNTNECQKSPSHEEDIFLKKDDGNEMGLKEEGDGNSDESDTCVEEKGITNEETETPVKSKRKIISSINWLYFTRISSVDDKKKKAECNLCHRVLSYESTTANLRIHLERKHPGEGIPVREDGRKRVLLSAKGQLFEIDEDDCNEEQTGEEPEVLYLDDFSEEETEQTTIPKRMKLANPLQENEAVESPGSKAKSEDSLDHFGKYLVSLLRQLPNKVSSKLQADFVSQVIKAQMDVEKE